MALLSELDCMTVDLRPFLYERLRERPYRLGSLTATFERDVLRLDGHAHGRPVHLALPVREVRARRVRRRRVSCPGCDRWIWCLRIQPDGTAGCRGCLRLLRRDHDVGLRFYRKHPLELLKALDAPEPKIRGRAFRALAAGPIRGKRSTPFPGKKLVVPWPEALLDLRYQLAGYFAYE